MVGGALQDSVRYFCAFVFVFVFEELVFVSPSPLLSFSLSPVFSDGWWCIAGVSQAESLLQTEPNLTFTAGRLLPTTRESLLQKVFSRKSASNRAQPNIHCRLLPTTPESLRTQPYIHFALPQTVSPERGPSIHFVNRVEIVVSQPARKGTQFNILTTR